MTPSLEQLAGAMTAEETAFFALAAMMSAVDEDGQRAVIVRVIQDARNEALEEAAKVAEEGEFIPDNLPPKLKLIIDRALSDATAAIRALRSTQEG